MSDLLKLIYEDQDDLVEQVQASLRQGADPSALTEYGESPLRVASRNGRFEIVRLLLDAGADAAQLGWSDLFFDVVFGSNEKLETTLRGDADLSARDYWERTPWLLALRVGSVEKAAILLAAGADPAARGRCGKTPMAHAIEGDHDDVVRWLISMGADIECSDDFEDTALIAAASCGARACVQLLLEHGANVFAQNHIPYRAIEVTGDLAIVKMLLEAGENINDLDGETRAKLTGLAASPTPEVSGDEYLRARHRRFGVSNPERADEPFWQLMIRSRDSAYRARERFEGGQRSSQPVWSFLRFGTSITPLGDGRFIEIGGEHEDYYDPDFCIYNDVFVHDGRDNCAIYLYPRAVFPPTDFHSATLVGEQIWIIGNLGYPEDRRPGETPVFVLDVPSLAITRVDTSGDAPGWISGHRADLTDDGEIVVRGGKLISRDDGGDEIYVDNRGAFSLSPSSRAWTRLGDA